jgi:hypothetical protein
MPASDFDRRNAPRAGVSGTVTLWRRHRIHERYALCDLSVGGCLLQGPRPGEPGKLYHAVLCIEGHRHSLRRPAWIVRQWQQTERLWSLGLGFFEPCSAFVPELVSHKGRVLVAHRSPARRDALAAAIVSLGYEAVEAGSLAEALWEVENGPSDFLTAFVAHDLGDGSDGENLLEYMRSFYPATHRVLLGNRDAFGGAVACGPALAVLCAPFSTTRLAAEIPDPISLYPSPPTSKYGSNGSTDAAHSAQNST